MLVPFAACRFLEKLVVPPSGFRHPVSIALGVIRKASLMGLSVVAGRDSSPTAYFLAFYTFLGNLGVSFQDSIIFAFCMHANLRMPADNAKFYC